MLHIGVWAVKRDERDKMDLFLLRRQSGHYFPASKSLSKTFRKHGRFLKDFDLPLAGPKTNVFATGPWGKRISIALNNHSNDMNSRS